MKDEDKMKKQLLQELAQMRRRIAEMEALQLQRKYAEESLRLSHQLLRIANRHTEMHPLLSEFVTALKSSTGCAAVGVRILDAAGSIPYQAWDGFSDAFYMLESPLSIKSDQCMCINVIKRMTDPKLPFYTEGGSFYMNSTTRFLATVSEEEKGRTRNVCNQFGYESVALVPIRFREEIQGLMHVADPLENMIPLETVEALEATGMQLGATLQRVWAEEEVRKLARFPSENPNPVLRVNREGMIIYANEASQMLLRHWGRAVGDCVPTICLNSVTQALTSDSERILEVQCNGRLFSFVVAPVKRAGCTNLYGRDVTEQRRAEEALREARNELEARVKQRTAELARANEALRAEIAHRKQTEEELKDSNALLDRVFDTTHILVAYLDMEFNFVRVNRKYAEADGHTPDFFPGKNHFDLYPHGENKELFQEVVRTGEPYFTYEKPFVYPEHPGRGVTYWDWSLQPVRDEGGQTEGLLLCILDATERKRAQEEIGVYQEKLRSLATELSLTQQSERREIATSLHDQIGQALALSKIKLAALRQSVSRPELAGALDEVRQLIGQSIDYTRSLIFELSPPILYEIGLEAALERLVENTEQQHTIPTKFEDDGQQKRLEADVRVVVFQSVRELVINAVKHARAHSLEVSTCREGGEMHVRVADDGVGFGASLAGFHLHKTGGFGLFCIRERLDHLGGRLDLWSKPGQGTIATIVVPISPENDKT